MSFMLIFTMDIKNEINNEASPRLRFFFFLFLVPVPGCRMSQRFLTGSDMHYFN
jgi:hypothetical protein